MPSRRVRLAVLTVAAVGLVVAGGCGTGGQTMSHREAARIRMNPTPELITLYQRPVDVRNQLAITRNENHRMIVQDLGRAFLTDRPSRLTREPIPW